MAVGAVGLQTHIWNNNLKSILLLLGYPFLLLFLLWAFFFFMAASDPHEPMTSAEAGFHGVANYWHIMVGIAAVWFLIAWLSHQRLINKATGAHTLSRKDHPRIYNLLENLCISRGIPMPQLFMIDTPVLNAYASGLSEKSYAITVTSGIVEALNDQELEAVLAHELSHILNRDVRLLVVSVIFVGMISFFAEMAWRSMVYRRGGGRKDGRIVLVAAIILAIGYVFAILIRFALSRKREFLADAGAVDLTKNPDAMANALRKISGKAKLEGVPAEVAQMMIENKAEFAGIFATHPPIEARIRALEQYAGATGYVAPMPAPPPPPSTQENKPQTGPWIGRGIDPWGRR